MDVLQDNENFKGSIATIDEMNGEQKFELKSRKTIESMTFSLEFRFNFLGKLLKIVLSNIFLVLSKEEMQQIYDDNVGTDFEVMTLGDDDYGSDFDDLYWI